MALESAEDNIILSVGGMIVAAVVAGIFRKARSSRWVSKAWEAVRALASSIRLCRHEPDDDMGVVVREKIQKQILHDFRMACQALGVLALPFTMRMLVDIATGHPRTSSLTQEVMILLMQSICGATFICPSLLRWQTIDVFFGAIVLVFSVYLLPGIRQTLGTIGILLLMFNVAIFLLSVSRRDVRVVVPLNLLFGAAASAAILKQAAVCIPRPSNFVFIQWASGLAITISAHMLSMNCRAVTYQRVEMKATKEVLAAASALLRSCCDVVVELNNEGIILNQDMDLGSFLLRGPSRCLQGCRLTDLMSHEEDKHSFTDSLRASNDSSMAQAVHVRMKDGNDSVLHLQLMWFQFTHVDDQPHYMVGIRNFPSGICKESQQPTTGQPSGHVSSERSAGFDPESQDTVSNTSEPWLPMLVVNATEVGSPVMGYSMGFGSRIGRVPLQTQFAELVKPKDRFVEWLGNSLNQAAHGDPHDPCRLTLLMPQGPIKATCTILVRRSAKGAGMVEMHKEVEADQEEGDEDERSESEEQDYLVDPRRLCLVFSEMKKREGSQPRAPARLKGTPGSATVSPPRSTAVAL